MTFFALVAVMLTSAVMFLVVGAALAVVIFSRVNQRRGNRGLSDTEEIRKIQEIHAGLERIESRVDALETALFTERGEEL